MRLLVIFNKLVLLPLVDLLRLVLTLSLPDAHIDAKSKGRDNEQDACYEEDQADAHATRSVVMRFKW